MPRTKIDYQKTIIYKLVCNDLNVPFLYVGFTIDFTRRKSLHKHNCNNPNSKNYNLKVYQFIRENGGWENWTMVLIEYYPCDDGMEARARERYWYEFLNASLNSNCPNRSYKEYYETNKEKIIEHQKEYYETNKEKITEHQKEYRENNKEHISQQKKEYRKTNKEKIEEKLKELITCECGRQFQRCKKSRHCKSQFHLNYIQSISSNETVIL